MATWEKIKFYYSSMLNADGAVVAASSTESTGDYDVAYLYNSLEINSWKASSAATTDITCTANGQYTNGDFEDGDTGGWTAAGINGGVVNDFTVETVSPWAGTYYCKVDITTPGSFYYSIYMISNGQVGSIKKGRAYKFLFACKAQANMTIRGILTGDSFPFATYATNVEQAVTTSWAHYEISFTALQDADDVRLGFYMGAGADWLEFDNIVFAEEESVCADYFIVHGHNFSSGTVAPASMILQYSDNNSVWTAVDVSLDNDFIHILGTKLFEFTKTGGHKYWRWRIYSPGMVPEAQLAAWGLKTELDYASVSFDPHAQNHKANVNVSYGGYVTGIHEQFVERRMSLGFTGADSALYTKIKRWIDTHGLKNLFIAWELANEPNEVFLMRPESNFNNSLTNGGAYRDIKISLIGRKE